MTLDIPLPNLLDKHGHHDHSHTHGHRVKPDEDRQPTRASATASMTGLAAATARRNVMMGGGLRANPATWNLSPMRVLMVVCILVVVLESVGAEEAKKKKGAAAEGRRVKKSKKIEKNPDESWEPPADEPPPDEPYDEDSTPGSNIQGKPWDDEKHEYEKQQQDKRQKEIDMWNEWFQFYVSDPVITKEISRADVVETEDVKTAMAVKGKQDGLLGQSQALGAIWDGFELESSRIWKYGSVYYTTMRSFVPFSTIGQQEMIWKKCWSLADEQKAHAKEATTETVTLKDMLDRYDDTSFEEGCKGWYKATSKFAEETTNPRVNVPTFLQKVGRHVDKLVELVQEYLSFKGKFQDKADYTLGRLAKGVNVTRNALVVAEEEWQSLELWMAVHKAAITAVERQHILSMKEIRNALRKQCKETGGCEPSKEFLAVDTIHLPGETVYPKLLKRLHQELRWFEKVLTKETEKTLRKPLNPPTSAQKKERKRALDAAAVGEDPSAPTDDSSDAKCDASVPNEGMDAAAAHAAATAELKDDVTPTLLTKKPLPEGEGEEAGEGAKEGKKKKKKKGKKAKAAETEAKEAPTEANAAEDKTAETKPAEANTEESEGGGW